MGLADYGIEFAKSWDCPLEWISFAKGVLNHDRSNRFRGCIFADAQPDSRRVPGNTAGMVPARTAIAAGRRPEGLAGAGRTASSV